MLSLKRLVPLSLVAFTTLFFLPVAAQEAKSHFPPDTQAVIRINFRSILGSELAKKLGIDQAKDFLQIVPGADVLKELGFDPFTDLDTITIAAPGGAKTEQGLIIVQGKFKAKKLIDKAEKEAKNNSESLKVIKIGKHTVFEVTVPNSQVPLFIAIPSDSIILVSPNKDYLEARLNGKNEELANKDLGKLFGSLDEKLALSVAVVSKALDLKSLPEQARGLLEGIETIGGGVALDKDISLELAVVTKDASAAKLISETLSQGLNQALGFLGLMAANQKELVPILEFAKSAKVTSKDKLVSISGKLPGSILEEAFKGKK
ncbi:MAG: hypothetical protein EXR99_06150 [Gemmataceae bacterium]|nr:hypothetical protein [Gemmataceae bacterium]